MINLIDKVKQTIIRENLIQKEDKILIGLSGGADSTFLFNALYQLKDELQFDIMTCHINHLYRESADIDEDFSRRISNEKQIEFVSKKVDMLKYSKENSLSLEDSGRILRYRSFQEILKEKGFNKIAIAHHLDDQVETFFLHLFRGSGLDGLTGIHYKNDNIIRPMLDISKDEILEYLSSQNIDFVTDETNFVADVLRNKLRLEMIPYVKENFNSSINYSIYRTISILKDSKEILDDAIQEKYDKLFHSDGKKYWIDVNSFNREKMSVKRNLIRKLLINLYDTNKDITSKYIEDIIKIFDSKTGSKYIFRDYSFLKSYDKVIITDNIANDKTEDIPFELGNIEFGGFLIKSYLTSDLNIKSSNGKMIFDSRILEEKLIIRSRKNGDKIRLKGFNKKIKDIFIDKKIPQMYRSSFPILASNDEIFAILSLKRSNLYKVNSNTSKVLVIEVTNEKQFK